MRISFLTAKHARLVSKAAVTDPLKNSSLRKPYKFYMKDIEKEIVKAALKGEMNTSYLLYCTSKSDNEKLSKLIKESLEKFGYSVEINMFCETLNISWDGNEEE